MYCCTFIRFFNKNYFAMDAPIGKNAKRILSDPELREQLMEILISRASEGEDNVVKVDGKRIEFIKKEASVKSGHDKK